jgi:hypothetical protein
MTRYGEPLYAPFASGYRWDVKVIVDGQMTWTCALISPASFGTMPPIVQV